MSDFDIKDIGREAEDQQRQAEYIKLEVERHKDRVEKLEQIGRQLQEAQRKVASEGLAHAQDAAERARIDALRDLDGFRKQRDELVKENEQLGRRVTEAYNVRSDAYHKYSVVRALAVGDDKEGAHLESVLSSLNRDMGEFARVDQELKVARQKLEALQF